MQLSIKQIKAFRTNSEESDYPGCRAVGQVIPGAVEVLGTHTVTQSLAYRRLRADMLQIYRLIHSLDKVLHDDDLTLDMHYNASAQWAGGIYVSVLFVCPSVTFFSAAITNEPFEGSH